ncbi:MAG: hypothetical protein WC307_04295 [Candidatus Nanoarchaeia archaeon]|jgi:hypothetical protein
MIGAGDINAKVTELSDYITDINNDLSNKKSELNNLSNKQAKLEKEAKDKTDLLKKCQLPESPDVKPTDIPEAPEINAPSEAKPASKPAVPSTPANPATAAKTAAPSAAKPAPTAPKQGTYSALSLFRGFYGAVFDGYRLNDQLKKQGQESNIELATEQSLAHYIIKEKLFDMGLISNSPYLKSLEGKIGDAKELNGKAKEVTAVIAVDKLKNGGLEGVIKSKEYQTDMNKTRKTMNDNDVKNVMKTLLDDSYDDHKELEKMNGEETYTALLAMTHGLHPKEAEKTRTQGWGKLLYGMINYEVKEDAS